MLDFQDSELRRYYAARAAEYDDDRQYPAERASDLQYLRSWVSEFFTGERVLDVACGTGSWTECIAQSAESVVGIDISQQMLEIARRRPGADRARFAIADAYFLSEELGAFQGAFVGFWFSHVPRSRIPQFLASLHRRLCPGATVLIIDNSEAFCRAVPISDRDDDGTTFQMRRLTDGSSFRVLKNFPTESELVAATAPFGVKPTFRKLEHFWTLDYENNASPQSIGA